MPKVLQGHYTGTSAGIHLPYLRGNEKVLTETFKWLYKNGYKDIAADIGREYKGHKHYLEGYTTENTITLKPSPLYENTYNISDAAKHSMFQDIMSAGSPVDVGLHAKAKFLGYGLYGTDRIVRNKTGFTEKKVKDMMADWQNITGQKKGCLR